MKNQLKNWVCLWIGIEKYQHVTRIIISINRYFFRIIRKRSCLQKENYVNWDPIDETVLANEQVIDGKGWRSGATVERKKLSQWFFNISKFSQNLLDGLENLDAWPIK